LFGPELENEVEYIGHRLEGMLKGFTDRLQFAAAIERGAYDLVLVQELGTLDPALPRRQEAWLQRLEFEPIVSGTNPAVGAPMRLYAAPGSLFADIG
jgi:hypothetical protein